MSDVVPGDVFYGDPFPVYDGSGTGTTVPGLVSANFTRQVYKNGATDAAAVTVTEIGSSGWYTPSFTPDVAGRWSASIVHASYGTWLVEDVECAAASSSSDPTILGSGTLQSGSVLDATASSDSNAYLGAILLPTGGAGVGQGGKLIATYNGTSKAFTTYANFATSLDNTTTYVIVAVVDYARFVGDVIGTAGSLTTDAITAASVSAAAVTKIQNGLATAAAVTALPTANQNADALLDRASAVDGYTPREAAALSLAALAGRDVGTLANPQYEAVDASKVRLDATIVAGIRTAVTRDAT